MYKLAPHKYAGSLLVPPTGLLFHSTRSGQTSPDWDIDDEYRSACNHLMSNVSYNKDGSPWYTAWHVTIGELRYAPHMPLDKYGWNAGEDGNDRIAYEFSQANRGDPISDEQIWSACKYTYEHVRPFYPDVYVVLLSTHGADFIVEHWQTWHGRKNVKSDVDPDNPGLLAYRFITELRKWDEMMKTI